MKKSLVIGGKTYELTMGPKKLNEKIQKIALQIKADYPDKTNPPVLVFVAMGAAWFGVDLTRALEKIGQPYLTDMIMVKSYGPSNRQGELKLICEPTIDLAGKHVIVVEDLVDKGKTLNFVDQNIKSKNPKSIQYAVLAVKKEHVDLTFSIKYRAVKKDLPKGPWIVGIGTDSEGLHRGLPGIYSEKKKSKKTKSSK